MSAVSSSVARWGMFEVHLTAPAMLLSDPAVNPFEVSLSAHFWPTDAPAAARKVRGFFFGDGEYRIRFSPTSSGTYSYRTLSTIAEMDGHLGTFAVGAAAADDHGPVHASAHTFHHADGTEHFSVGTTAYSWAHQSAHRRNSTLATLAPGGRGGAFNKLRMLLLPMWDPDGYYHVEPSRYPFMTVNDSGVCRQAQDCTNRWDWRRFDAQYWRSLDDVVGALRALRVQADLILFHPYDHCK